MNDMTDILLLPIAAITTAIIWHSINKAVQQMQLLAWYERRDRMSISDFREEFNRQYFKQDMAEKYSKNRS
jgi:hypothetical protein